MEPKPNLRSPDELRGAIETAGERVRELHTGAMPTIWDHTDDLLSLYEQETKDLLSILEA